jgi:hypothetical protein
VSEPSPPSWRASAWIENFARDGFGKPSVLTEIKSGSQPTHRWREMDSNPRSPVGEGIFETAPFELSGCERDGLLWTRSTL